jgi:predicted MFS family arabinose efflux permease
VTQRPPLWLLAATAGIAVANLYYNQPLLADIGRQFSAGARQVSWIPTSTQLGYAAGMLIFVPLGDLIERRALIFRLLLACAASLALAGLAPSLPLLATASFFIGLSSSVVQVAIPLAAYLSPPAEQGKTIGRVMSAVLLGILLARTLSGFLGGRLGWRAMFFAAAGLCLALAVLIPLRLPAAPPPESMSYRELIASLLRFARDYPVLRRAALIGACVFGSFMVFWTTLVFRLEAAPYHMGSQAAGLFGLVGCAGVFAAPLAGRAADRISSSVILLRAILLTVASFVVLWAGSFHLWGLVLGVILLDAGVQATHVANQTRIFALRAGAQARLNTVYMICYFSGAAIGSTAGALGWSRAGWTGVCAVGFMLASLALVVHLAPASSKQ